MTEQTKTFDIPAIHKAGFPFIAISAGVTLLLALTLGETAFWLCLIITAWVAYFFRDPERVTPAGPIWSSVPPMARSAKSNLQYHRKSWAWETPR